MRWAGALPILWRRRAARKYKGPPAAADGPWPCPVTPAERLLGLDRRRRPLERVLGARPDVGPRPGHLDLDAAALLRRIGVGRDVAQHVVVAGFVVDALERLREVVLV